MVADGIDYFNPFVGQYTLGDVQYLRFHSINNLHGMYWKQTKNFVDGCSAHFKDCTFEAFPGSHNNGFIYGPGGLGAFLVEGTRFAGRTFCALCSNQHCDIDDHTGALPCTPILVTMC